jgi:hypothetical protein
MALVDDDEIEEIGRILAKIGRGLAVLGRTAHEGLEDGKKQAGILRGPAFLADILRLYPHHGVLRERGEVVKGLVGEIIAVSQEEDTRAA